jgi:hypothetical protein
MASLNIFVAFVCGVTIAWAPSPANAEDDTCPDGYYDTGIQDGCIPCGDSLWGYEASDVALQPLHWWKLDGNGIDSGSSSVKVNVIPKDGANFPSSRGSLFGVDLPGKKDDSTDKKAHLDMTENFVFSGTTGFTWCAWVWTNPVQQDPGGFLLFLKDTSRKNSIILRTQNWDAVPNKHRIWMAAQNKGVQRGYAKGAVERPVLDENEWVHLAMTVDTLGKHLIIKNGVDTRYTSLDCTPVNTESITYTGAAMGRNEWVQDGVELAGQAFVGSLSDVRIYDRALSGAQLTAIMGETPRRSNSWKDGVTRSMPAASNAASFPVGNVCLAGKDEPCPV